MEQGFTAVKFDPAGAYSTFDPRQPSLERLELSALFCRRIREAVGTEADLLFGTHGQFTAVRRAPPGARLEPYDPLWFEEPVPPEMPEEMARGRARAPRSRSPTGERLTTKYEFARVLEQRAATILQLAISAASAASSKPRRSPPWPRPITPRSRRISIAGPIVGAANIQLAACSPNFLILESIEQWDGFHASC